VRASETSNDSFLELQNPVAVEEPLGIRQTAGADASIRTKVLMHDSDELGSAKVPNALTDCGIWLTSFSRCRPFSGNYRNQFPISELTKNIELGESLAESPSINVN
jgi:hypothetical protein